MRSVACAFIAAAATLQVAASTCQANVAQGVDAESFAKIKFDYLVIGGGTAGVTLSARLSEDPSLVVGLIEAGTTHFDDPMIDVPANSGAGNATYDWMFESIVQPSLGNRTIAIPRGKMLGGSSAINDLAWGRASAPEYATWAAFSGSPEWTFDGLLPYFKASENVSTEYAYSYPGISSQQEAQAQDAAGRFDGYGGPIQATHNSFYFDVALKVVDAMNVMGVPTNALPEGGNAAGVTNAFASFDREQGVRSYAAPAYFCSHAQNRNYHVLLNTQATKVIFDKTLLGLVATGVQFVNGRKTYVASAKREVILSAGAVQTPQLLELSGIGNPTILREHGIEALVDLPGVGENLQDHVFTSAQFQLKQGVQTFDALDYNSTFASQQAQLYATNRSGLLSTMDDCAIFLSLQQVVNSTRLRDLMGIFDQEAQARSATPLQRLQDTFQRQWFEQGNVASVEIIELSRGIIDPVANESYVSFLAGILHPRSRGSVHIFSSDPLQAPTIDTGFITSEFDSQLMIDVAKYLPRLTSTSPLADMVVAQSYPDPSLQTDDELLTWVRSVLSHGSHLLGTAAMATRELGGVVDSSLKVYGTTNLRVVDASIIPIQIACHTQATVYAIAEKAAAMIRNMSP